MKTIVLLGAKHNNMENKKLVTILILITTVILAGIALFTALKLYQINQGRALPSASPVVKKSVEPSAEEPLQEVVIGAGICELTFTVTVSPPPSGSPSPSPSRSPSPLPSQLPSPSPSTASQCWDTCTYDSQCPGSLVCRDVSGANRCVNDNCPAESDCVCLTTSSPNPSVSPSPSSLVSEASTVPTQALPEAGFVSPTVVFSVGGLLLLLLGLLL